MTSRDEKRLSLQKGVTTMKKFVAILAVMAFALTLGAGFAFSNVSVIYSEDVSDNLYNGITVFAGGPSSFDSGLINTSPEAATMSGSAAGGLVSSEYGMEPYNGITIFSVGSAWFDSGLINMPPETVAMSGSAAGGLVSSEYGMEPYNGITVFHESPAVFDQANQP
jgi:hypothetical protein